MSNIVYSSLNGFKNTEVGKNLGDGSRYSLAIAPLTSGFIFTQITRPPSANSNPPIEESWTVNCASDLQAQSSLTSSTNISYSSNATQTTETVATTFSGGIENQEQSTIPGSLMVLRSWWRGTNGEQDNTCEMHGTGCTGPRSPGMTCCGTGCLAEGTWQPKCICGDDPPPTGGGTSGGSGSGGGSTGGGGGGCDPVGGSATVNDITQSAACGVGCRTNVDCPRGFCCNNGNCATACGISGNSDNGGVLEW